MKKTYIILPRFIRFRDAPIYLGMDRNRFNSEVRPFIKQISIGKQGVAFDRLDLDQWADHYIQRHAERPNITKRGNLWVKNDKNQRCQDYLKGEGFGTLISKSLDDEYARLLAPNPIKKLKPSSLAESKKHDRQ